MESGAKSPRVFPTPDTPGGAAGLSHTEIGPWLRALRSRIAGSARELARSTADEIGKPYDEALAGDVLALLAAVRWHEKHAHRVLAPRSFFGKPLWLLGVRSKEIRVPLGRVGIIATWNYPVQLLGIQMVQAITAGNALRVKPSEHAPRTQGMLLDIFEEGAPTGLIERTAATREAGRDMIAAGGLDHVVFTGSTGVGRAIAETLGDRLVPSTLELTGRDSAFVLADADPALAARSIWAGLTINGGQTCMAPRRALVHEHVYAEFIRQLGLIAAGEAPRLLITDAAATQAYEAAVAGVEAGGRALSSLLEPPSGRSMRPVAIVDCPPDAPTVAGLHFGPVLAVVPVRNESEMLAVHHAHPQHLATSIFTRRPQAHKALAGRAGSSVVTFNDCIIPTGHPATSIGGVASSGWGASRGVEGLLAMTRPVHVSTTHPRFRLPVGPTPPDQPKRLLQMMGVLYGKPKPSQPLPRHPHPPAAADTRGTKEPASR